MKKQEMIYYGGDYNPDQWDAATIEEDMRLFKLAGVNLVTLPVFSWAKLEPSEGVYDFGWLDAILDKLWANGIRVCLATPTTAQPAWMSVQYPEVLPVDIAGRKRTHGMRVFFCVNSEKYRERAAAIAQQMAQRYANHPALAIWHVANEYGTYCYCPTCQAKFRTWLQKRYGGIEELNARWNTSFWGRTVYSFDEVFLPTELNDDNRFNPSVQLDYLRFITDSTIGCFQNEYDVLKKYSPDIPITTNMSGYIKKLDQFAMASHLDVVGWDNYPSPTDPPHFIAFKHDIMRGLKGGAPYFLMEQSPNQQNWQPYNKLKKPGEVRLLSYQAMAHGADTCLFFQLRQSVAGQEKFHGALIGHVGNEHTRVFRECAQLGEELNKLGPSFVGGRTPAKVGFLFDWNNWWAVENNTGRGPNRDIDYFKTVTGYYKAFHDRNIPVDVLSVESELSGYDLVVAPMLYMLKPGVPQKLDGYVKNGGTLVATVMSGLADENDRSVFGGYPGPLRDALGIWVEEIDALLPGEGNTMVPTPGASGLEGEYGCNLLCDIIHLQSAQPLATYQTDFYGGTPCATVNTYGAGKGYYIGTQPDERFISDLVERLCREQNLTSAYPAQPGVEVALRKSPQGSFVFVLNHNQQAATVDFGSHTLDDLLNGCPRTGQCTIEPRDVWVLRRRPENT